MKYKEVHFLGNNPPMENYTSYYPNSFPTKNQGNGVPNFDPRFSNTMSEQVNYGSPQFATSMPLFSQSKTYSTLQPVFRNELNSVPTSSLSVPFPNIRSTGYPSTTQYTEQMNIQIVDHRHQPLFSDKSNATSTRGTFIYLCYSIWTFLKLIKMKKKIFFNTIKNMFH